MLETPDIEQNHYPENSSGIYKIRHDCIRLMKWLAFYDRFFVKYELL